MRVPPFEQYTNFMQGIGLLIAGGIIGAAVFMSIYKQNLNYLMEQYGVLQKENKDLLAQIDNYDKTRHKQSVINDVEVVVSSGDSAELDKMTTTEISSRIKKDLKPIIGQKIAGFTDNPQLYEQLIAQRIYENVADQAYIVQVKTMVLSQSHLKLWVTAKPWKRLPAG